MIKLIKGDCLEIMPTLDAGSVDLVLCDLPYGTTACAWDSVIPFGKLWPEYQRLQRRGGVTALTSAQPFTTEVIASNVKDFKYCWYWLKNQVTGFANAKKQPLRCIEDVAIFYGAPPRYRPQGLIKCGKSVKNGRSTGGDTLRADTAKSAGRGGLRTAGNEYIQEFTGYPRQVLEIARDASKVHPTQKPVALMEYLIRTYTNPGDLVLDNCMGSGTTGVACVNTGRRFIGIERDDNYFEIAQRRIAEAQAVRDAFIAEML